MREESVVHLFERESDRLIEAAFVDGVTEDEMNEVQSQWRPAMQDLLNRLAQAEIPSSQWPEHKHWNWSVLAIKSIIDDLRAFGITHDGEVQGLMLLKPKVKSKLDDSKNAVSVEFVAAAPWNLDIEPVQRGKYKLVGKVMLAAAVQYSRESGFDGRVALLSLPQSVQWYVKQGFTEEPDSGKGRLRYFELTPDQAQRFLPENINDETEN